MTTTTATIDRINADISYHREMTYEWGTEMWLLRHKTLRGIKVSAARHDRTTRKLAHHRHLLAVARSELALEEAAIERRNRKLAR